MNRFKKTRKLALLLPLLAATGCFSTVSNMTPGKMEWIQQTSDAPRVGNAYLIRGLIGLFSGGIDQLTAKINDAGVRAHVFQEDQHKQICKAIAETYQGTKGDHEPIVLIGHSLGADDAILAARALDEVNVPVDMLITIDPTRPLKVPKNVKIVYNYYQPSVFDGTGILRGIALETEPGFKGQLHNMNVRAEYKELLEWDTNHVNIDKNNKVHADIIAKMEPLCMPRAQWVAMRRGTSMAGSTSRPSATPTAASAKPSPNASAGTGELVSSPAGGQ